MFRGVVSPPLRNMDAALAKIVDGVLSAVTKILTISGKSPILDVLLGFEFASVCF